PTGAPHAPLTTGPRANSPGTRAAGPSPGACGAGLSRKRERLRADGGPIHTSHLEGRRRDPAANQAGAPETEEDLGDVERPQAQLADDVAHAVAAGDLLEHAELLARDGP